MGRGERSRASYACAPLPSTPFFAYPLCIVPKALPPLEKLLRDPKARDALTDVQLYNFIEQLRQAAAGLGRPSVEPDPASFAVRLSRGEWRAADHLRLLSTHLSRLERREQRFLAVSMPPRHGKSQLIDVWLPIWWLTRNPKARVILAGYGETFARLWGAQVRDKLIEFSEETNVRISPDQTAADDWQTTLGGGMVCVGVGGSLVGRGADLLIIDDPIKNDQEANSLTYRERMWNWWQASAFTRLQPNGVVVIVCTRWHEDDLIGRILREDSAKRWTFLNLPALAEANDPLNRQPGVPLWPEQFPDDPSYEIRRTSMSPYWWAAQFQGSPTPEGGGLIQRDWFRFYHSLPEDCDQWIQSWDPALLDKTSSDYWVGQVWARKGATLYLVDSARGHYNLAQAAGIIRAWQLRYPRASAKLVENSAMGPAVIQTLQHEVPGLIPWPPRRNQGGQRQGSKRSRVEAIVPVLMAGNVYLPENKDGTKPRWVWDLVEECAAFDKGVHDDQVDALSQAVSFLLPSAWQHQRSEEEAASVPPPPSPREQLVASFNTYSKNVLAKAARRFSPRTSSRARW